MLRTRHRPANNRSIARGRTDAEIHGSGETRDGRRLRCRALRSCRRGALPTPAFAWLPLSRRELTPGMTVVYAAVVPIRPDDGARSRGTERRRVWRSVQRMASGHLPTLRSLVGPAANHANKEPTNVTPSPSAPHERKARRASPARADHDPPPPFHGTLKWRCNRPQRGALVRHHLDGRRTPDLGDRHRAPRRVCSDRSAPAASLDPDHASNVGLSAGVPEPIAEWRAQVLRTSRAGRPELPIACARRLAKRLGVASHANSVFSQRKEKLMVRPTALVPARAGRTANQTSGPAAPARRDQPTLAYTWLEARGTPIALDSARMGAGRGCAHQVLDEMRQGFAHGLFQPWPRASNPELLRRGRSRAPESGRSRPLVNFPFSRHYKRAMSALVAGSSDTVQDLDFRILGPVELLRGGHAVEFGHAVAHRVGGAAATCE